MTDVLLFQNQPSKNDTKHQRFNFVFIYHQNPQNQGYLSKNQVQHKEDTKYPH